jgi:hypothetical protein
MYMYEHQAAGLRFETDCIIYREKQIFIVLSNLKFGAEFHTPSGVSTYPQVSAFS